MPCYKPLRGWLSKNFNENGNRYIVFRYQDGFSDMEYQIPCGQCMGCRLEKSRQWATRCLHESELYEDNCFITLTYNPTFCPSDGSLKKADFQKFMKRLRKYFKGRKIRYLMCGEYGADFQRPHYHACLFNIDFPDRELWDSRRGVRLYRSKILESLWPFGFCTVGDVTFESAAYVARYVTKKITGEKAEGHYQGRVPEYATMSRRPGLGHDWFLKFKDDVFPHDFLVIRGDVKTKPPKYYDGIYENELTELEKFRKIKATRERSAKDSKENKPERLRVREKVKLSRTKLLERSYEKDERTG